MTTSAYTTRVCAAALALAAVTACKDVAKPDLNNPSLEGLENNPSRVTITQAIRGVVEGHRQNSGFPLQMGIIGREVYNLQSAEPRWTGELLGTGPLGPASFGGAIWGGQYRTVRTSNVVIGALAASTQLTDQEKDATRGIVNTVKAMELFTVWASHDTAGMVIDVDGPPSQPAPLLCAAPAIAAISQLLDSARTQLSNGVASGFPYTALPTGYANFNTRTTLLQVNRAWKAKVELYRKQYQSALTALGESFIDTGTTPLTVAQARTLLDRGPAHVFSTSAGDLLSTLFTPTSGNVRAHPSVRTGAETGPNGIDARYTAKIVVAPNRSDQGVASDLGVVAFPTNTSPVAIIRNEELILLRAQANHGLGNLAAASRDVNFIRAKSGNLAPKTHATLDALLDDLLYNKLYSLFYETGSRWLDMRFYNRLDRLPKDLPTHRVHPNYPLPSNESLARGGVITCSAS